MSYVMPNTIKYRNSKSSSELSAGKNLNPQSNWRASMNIEEVPITIYEERKKINSPMATSP